MNTHCSGTATAAPHRLQGFGRPTAQHPFGPPLTSREVSAAEFWRRQNSRNLALRENRVAATADKPNDPTAFLLERTIQLQTALESRILLEQAKGVLAERETRVGQQERRQNLRLKEMGRGGLKRTPTALLLVALDDLRAPDVSAAWVASCVAQCASLAQQVPTLVERYLDARQALAVGLSGGAGRLAFPQLVLFGDELLDLSMDLRVVHQASR